jgi:hypothetical protein
MARPLLLALAVAVGAAWMPVGAAASLPTPRVLTPHVLVPAAARGAGSRWLQRPWVAGVLRLAGTTTGRVSLDGRSLVFFVVHERFQGDTYWCQHLYISQTGGLAPAHLGVAGTCLTTRAEAEHSLRMHLGYAPEGHLLLARVVPARADRIRIDPMWPRYGGTSVVRLDGCPLLASGSRLVLIDVGRRGIRRMDVLAGGKTIETLPGI